MEKIKVLLMGVGAVGREAVKCITTKRGLEIVGAIDPETGVGNDLGEVAGICKKLGVTITNDADTLLSEIKADVLIHTSAGHLDDLYNQVKVAVEAGTNVVTVADQMGGNAYYYNPEMAAKLDTLARNSGVSIMGSGLWPNWLDLLLPLTLSGGCRNVRKVTYERHSDLRPYRETSSSVYQRFGCELTQEEFGRGLTDGTIYCHAFEGDFEALAFHFGWQLEEIRQEIEPVYENGRVIANRNSGIGFVDGEARIEMSICAQIHPDMKTSDVIQIDADPPVSMVISPAITGIAPVGNALVNAIPLVMRAKPGLVTTPEVGLFSFGNDVRLFL
jgi:4-hydroxy-tetrahydrodipicolinate reductase